MGTIAERRDLFSGYGDGFGEGGAEQDWFGGGAYADLVGAFEGQLGAEGEFDAGADAFGGEVAKHGGVLVGDAGDAGCLAGDELG